MRGRVKVPGVLKWFLGGLGLCLFFATVTPAIPQVNDVHRAYTGESVAGTVRRLAEKELLLQISAGKILRFRLLAKTEFHDTDGKPLRDSLLKAGDNVAVYVDPDDIETAVHVALLRNGGDSEHLAGSLPVQESLVAVPAAGDFVATSQAQSDPPTAAGTAPPPLIFTPPTLNIPVIPTLVIARKIEPVYSPEARAAGIEGTVLLSLEVNQDGSVGGVRVVRGLGFGLDQSAVTAVWQWQYQPFTATSYPAFTAVEVPFVVGPPGTWLFSGSKFSFPPGLPIRGTTIMPVLIGYTRPDSGVCPTGPVYVPVNLTIGTKGQPADVGIEGVIDGAIGKAAIDAVRSWVFRPGKMDGSSKPMSGTILLECGAPEPNGSVDPGSVRVGNGVSPPSVIFKVDPEYSEAARRAKFSGSAMLSLVVDGEGRPTDIHIVKALGMGLDERAIAAVLQWRFKPGIKGGRPIKVRAQIEINFRLL